MNSPSFVTSSRSTVTLSWASTICVLRSLARRNISAGLPSIGATTTARENSTRGRVRANLAKISPVAMAIPSMPSSASIATRMFARSVTGVILP